MKPTNLSRRQLLQLGVTSAGLSWRTARQASPPPLSEEPLRTRGLFLHVWDLRDEGVDRVLGWMRDSGLNQMLIAGSFPASSGSGWAFPPTLNSFAPPSRR